MLEYCEAGNLAEAIQQGKLKMPKQECPDMVSRAGFLLEGSESRKGEAVVLKGGLYLVVVAVVVGAGAVRAMGLVGEGCHWFRV